MTIGRLILILPLLVALAAGCGKGNPNAPASISGKVTYKSKPVTGGMITFHTNDAGINQVPIMPDGTYSYEGLPVGELKVSIDTEALNPDRKKGQQYGGAQGKNMMSPGPEGVGKAPAGPPGMTEGTLQGEYVKIPPKYRDKATSGLTVTLSKGQNTNKDFELTD
jgi:hypothetical protein